MNNEKINWFWAHRRNASLHHFSFLMHGLAGKGWSPVINFWFDNQIVIKSLKNILENVSQYQIKAYICITKSKHHDNDKSN